MNGETVKEMVTSVGYIASIIIFGLFFFFSIESLIFFLLKLVIGYISLTFIFDFFLHLVLIHYYTGISLFIQQMTLIKRLTMYWDGCSHAEDIQEDLTNTIISLKDLLDVRQIVVNDPFPDIRTGYKVIKDYVAIYTKMKKNYGLSQYQSVFYNAILSFADTYENYNFNNYVELSTKDSEIFKRGINQLIFDSNYIIYLLDEFLCKNDLWFSYHKLKTLLYNDMLGSLNQLRVKFDNNFFGAKYYEMKTDDNYILEYTIIKTASVQNDTLPNLLIFCIPNGMIYQSFPPSRLSTYLYKNVDILIWNYRGYGGSTGCSTFYNVKRDAIALYDEVVGRNPGMWGSVGVHGYSIGGIAAAHLARYRKIDLLVSDRNFSNIDYIARSYQTFGFILFILYKLLIMNSSYTIENFMNTMNKKCYKVVLCDPNDGIVLNNGSVKSGISRYVIKNYIEGNVKRVNKILDFLFDSNMKKDLLDSILFISDCYSKDNLYEKDAEFLEAHYQEDKFFILDDIKTNIRSFFGAFSASSDTLSTINEIKVNRLKRMYLDTFFNNLAIWGCHSKEEKEFEYYLPKSNERIINKALNYLYKIITNEKIKEMNNKGEHLEIVRQVEKLHNVLTLFKDRLKSMKYTTEDVNKGHLISISCGHNGMPSNNEYDMFVYHLLKSKFIIY